MVKGKVFQASTALRHTVETVKIVMENKSSDGVNSDYPIQLEYTDGGPDHSTTFWTVKFACSEVCYAGSRSVSCC